jgi:eukaryotic-like serine/threonine-protein kinase
MIAIMAENASSTKPFSFEAAAALPRVFEVSDTYKANKKYVTDKAGQINVVYQHFTHANLLQERYEIDVSREVSAFSKRHAKAYHVTDKQLPSRKCIGYVVDYYHPHRHTALGKLREVHHPHLIELVEAGIVFIEPWKANRFVIIYEQPEGVSLASLLEQKQFYKPSEIMKRLIAPIAAALQKLEASEVHHGNINPDNIFISPTRVILGDCLAEPAGLMQPDIYEPLEHIQAPPDVRGNGTMASDMYALAIIALDVMNVLGSRKQLTREQLLSVLLTRGSYNSFVLQEQMMPLSVVDFLRGVLIETPSERWKPDHIMLAAGGKQFNLIAPNIPQDSKRTQSFEGVEHTTMRALAYAFRASPDAACNTLRDPKFIKWLETIPYQAETKDRMEKVSQRMRRITASSAQRHELLARAISILDPDGPIRYKELSVHPSHLPLFLCQLMRSADMNQRSLLQELLTADLIVFWRELRPSHFHSLGWDPEAIRSVLRFHSLGFGIERLMYEMNPAMSCLSQDYLPYYATNAKTLLQILDSTAMQHEQSPFLDRHIMAFISARAGIRKEVPMKEYKDYPEIANHLELKSIIMLAVIQEKTKAGALHGLSCRASLVIIECIEAFRSRDVRASLSRDMKIALPKGSLGLLVRILQNKDYLNKDTMGYQVAAVQFRKNASTLIHLRDKRSMSTKALKRGLSVAFLISLMILFGVSYHMLDKMTQ